MKNEIGGGLERIKRLLDSKQETSELRENNLALVKELLSKLRKNNLTKKSNYEDGTSEHDSIIRLLNDVESSYYAYKMGATAIRNVKSLGIRFMEDGSMHYPDGTIRFPEDRLIRYPNGDLGFDRTVRFEEIYGPDHPMTKLKEEIEAGISMEPLETKDDEKGKIIDLKQRQRQELRDKILAKHNGKNYNMDKKENKPVQLFYLDYFFEGKSEVFSEMELNSKRKEQNLNKFGNFIREINSGKVDGDEEVKKFISDLTNAYWMYKTGDREVGEPLRNLIPMDYPEAVMFNFDAPMFKQKTISDSGEKETEKGKLIDIVKRRSKDLMDRIMEKHRRDKGE